MGEKSTIAVSLCCGGEEGDEIATIQFIKCLSSLDAVNDALGCVLVLWTGAQG